MNVQIGTDKTAEPLRNTAELRQVLDHMAATANTNNKRLITCYCKLAALTGLRYSDLITLTFADIKINGVYKTKLSVAQVKSQNIYLKRGLSNAEAKRKASVLIRLNEQTHDIFDELDLLQAPENKDVLLFRSLSRNAKNNNPIRPNALNLWLKQIATELRLTVKLSVHSFRKTLATLLLTEHGHTLASVSGRLGHRNIATTDAYVSKHIAPVGSTEMCL